MIWMTGGRGDFAGAGGGVGAAARGSLESALPGEWAVFFVVLAVIALIGAAILVMTCLGHERAVVRRLVRRGR
jgi:hypothetical protein